MGMKGKQEVMELGRERSEEDNPSFIVQELADKVIFYSLSMFQLQPVLMIITALGLFTCGI